ncbi:MAG: hypothetical protein A2Y62_22140 [Candidatus Fischerbacteria bacterium RBG_13_37_8]|uniref:SMP-30/Gluconolactonase/LRE-like region domain-containing protein n=1 Tax=Candidatus Fischerbacteria bacterium RBG_13_37_8 TaxID=1817863 RepID=A0A1F5VY67_9BACT|nr:MAG: hypothetical protein A2Y62_22140 [Candidatus Fischerbacteria bacterium RBG_13_37_8]
MKCRIFITSIFCIYLAALIPLFTQGSDLEFQTPSSIAARIIMNDGFYKLSMAISQPELGKVFWWIKDSLVEISTQGPLGVAIDDSGNLWIGDESRNAIIKIYEDQQGYSYTCINSNTYIDQPVDFEFMNGKLILLDSGKGTVTVWDNNFNPAVLLQGLIYPSAMKLVPVTPVADKPNDIAKNSGVRKLHRSGQTTIEDYAYLYVSNLKQAGSFDTNRPVIHEYYTDLNTVVFQKDFGKNRLELPAGIEILDNASLLVLDAHLANIYAFDLASGLYQWRIGKYGMEPDGWRNPSSVALIGICAVIADRGNDRITVKAINGDNWRCNSVLEEIEQIAQEIQNRDVKDSHQLTIVNCEEK